MVSRVLDRKRTGSLVIPINIVLMILCVLVITITHVQYFWSVFQRWYLLNRVGWIERAWLPSVVFVASLIGVYLLMRRLGTEGVQPKGFAPNVAVPAIFFVWTLLIQLSFIYVPGIATICDVMVSENHAYYFYAPAKASDVPGFIDWTFSLMRMGSLMRLGTHLPGWPLLLFLVFAIVGGKQAVPSVLAVLILTSLTTVPLYFLAKKLFGFKTALLACMMFLYVPDFIIHIPWMDLTLGLFTTLAVLLFVYAVKKGDIYYAIISGLVFFIAIFMNLASIVVAVLLLTWGFLTRKSLPRLSRLLLATALGTLFLPVITQLAFNLPIFESLSWWSKGVFFRGEFAPEVGERIPLLERLLGHLLTKKTREYRLSLFYIFVFAGVPVSFLFFESLVRAIKTRLIHSFLLSFVAMLSVFLFLENVEFVRRGMFLIPLMLILSANELVKAKQDTTRYVSLILAFQFIQTLIFYPLIVPFYFSYILP